MISRAAVIAAAQALLDQANALPADPVIVPPPQPAPSGIDPNAQYAVDDAGSSTLDADAGGPSYRSWSERLGLRWKNLNVGDWTDADGVAQGPKPFTTVALPVIASGAVGRYVDFDVAPLIARALQAGNKGIRAITNAGGWARIAGRVSANPPRLVVNGVDCSCTASALYQPLGASARSSNSSVEVSLSNGTAIFRFDLAAIAAPITAAVMRLYLNSSGGTAPKISLFECAPPDPIQLGAGSMTAQLGLSAAVGEANLRGHPGVYMAGDFAGTYFDATRGCYVAPKLFPRINCDPHNAPEFIVEPDGSTSWRGSFVELPPTLPNLGATPMRSAFDGTFQLMGVDLSDPKRPAIGVIDELWYRMYLMLEDDFVSPYDANKMGITFDLRMGYWVDGSGATSGYWQNTTGNGGLRGDGKRRLRANGRWEYQGHMERMEQGFIGRPDDPLGRFRTLDGYNYHIDQAGPYPGGSSDPLGGPVYNDLAHAELVNGRWFCLEQRLRMNSIDMSAPDALGNGVALHDGLIETWIDGVKVSSLVGYRWRCHPEMGIAQINANWYYGGRKQLDARMHFRMKDLVAANGYIGPRGG